MEFDDDGYFFVDRCADRDHLRLARI
jgi:hypothetical protein